MIIMMLVMVRMNGREDDNTENLKELAKGAVGNLVQIIDDAKIAFPDLYDHLRVPRQMSVYLAGQLGVPAPTFDK